MASLAVDKFVELAEIPHILARPDILVGSAERVPRETLCFNSTTSKLENKNVLHAAAQEQMFKEVLGNAADNVQRSRDMNIDPKVIEVTMTENMIRVKNYGVHIPIEISPQTGKYIPEMIFGSLRTGTNFDDNEKRITIGKNGVGAKATNIFSKQFDIECADPKKKQLYKQSWINNMNALPHTITNYVSDIGFTQVTYILDFQRFGINSYDEEAYGIYMAHCVNTSYTCKIPVYFNDNLIDIKTLAQYASCHIDITNHIEYISKDKTQEICIVDAPNAGGFVSFINGMITRGGGIHIKQMYEILRENTAKILDKQLKESGMAITKRELETHVFICCSFVIDKPTFTNQSKDTFNGPMTKIEIPDKTLNKLKDWKLIEQIYEQIMLKQALKLKSTDGKKSKRTNVKKLRDANITTSGGDTSQTVLILTEGDSATSYAEFFISQVPNNIGKDYFGILPLRGKLLNSINADFSKLIANAELKSIKVALGLQDNTDYSNPDARSKLRYGTLLCMTDSDNDGKHILGLILLFFLSRFDSLVNTGFFKFLRTPIVMTTNHGTSNRFYTMKSYLQWAATIGENVKNWKHNYFKGLGSFSEQKMKDEYTYRRAVTFQIDDQAGEKVKMAFDKLLADDRKQWLINFVEDQLLTIETFEEIPISLFIDQELIYYTIENAIRSIPNAIDGLKDSQRKCIWGGYKELKSDDEYKVSLLASHIAKVTAYKHGEKSLGETIHNMTANYVGSNNLEYFRSESMTGTRIAGGKDAGSPRYTFVAPIWWHKFIFRPEDKCIEERIEDEGHLQECKNFFPVLPMHVINGVNGVGTGFSSTIPAHSPCDIGFWFQCRLQYDITKNTNIQLPIIKPWYNKFTGQIAAENSNTFVTYGTLVQDDANPNNFTITELPIGMWTNKYENFLKLLQENEAFKNFKSYCTPHTIKFILEGVKNPETIEKRLKLTTNLSYKNMTVLHFTQDGRVQPIIYKNIQELLEDFYRLRLFYYQKRRQQVIKDITDEIFTISERARFILTVLEGKLEFRKRKESDVHKDMINMNFDPHLLDLVKSREFVHEKIQELNLKIEKKKIERDQLTAQSEQQIWYAEIEEFLVEYCKRTGYPRTTY